MILLDHKQCNFQYLGVIFRMQIILNRRESVVAEISSYCYSSADVNPYDQMNPAENIWLSLHRVISGDPQASMKRFTNDGTVPGCVTFSASHLGKIIPVEVDSIGTLLIRPEAFLCSTGEVT
eukprot:CAMPEP_0117813388 /NCGR_PEP_ID=MMETSP0948-20121206/23468_1 /TAXON_ID=44440 /ORGANISM="Chattonella subsalsa, Strain CCMP2191" /LENGTH=121 /DNA_ID=CAMNT_0005650713 /DNA_START=31 /DNA_END=396 /DNA_ORIENTATION=+